MWECECECVKGRGELWFGKCGDSLASFPWQQVLQKGLELSAENKGDKVKHWLKEELCQLLFPSPSCSGLPSSSFPLLSHLPPAVPRRSQIT